MTDISQQIIAQLLDHLDNADRELRDARRIIRQIEEIKSETYKQLPGIEGVFDGTYLVTQDGQKYEVPANYAAKSRLVYGDLLKMVEEEGKTMFKQIEKAPRKRIEGILNKKEGSWYILTDSGSYKISDNAAEFSRAEINDEAIALIPEGVIEVPFAALDKIITQKAPLAIQPQKVNENKQVNDRVKVEERKDKPRSVESRKPKSRNRPQVFKSSQVSQAPKTLEPKPVQGKPLQPGTESVTYTVGDEEDLR